MADKTLLVSLFDYYRGLPFSAAVIALIAFGFLEGTIRWVALGIAALEVIVTPQILKHAEQLPSISDFDATDQTASTKCDGVQLKFTVRDTPVRVTAL
jgi:hypothetical protein